MCVPPALWQQFMEYEYDGLVSINFGLTFGMWSEIGSDLIPDQTADSYSLSLTHVKWWYRVKHPLDLVSTVTNLFKISVTVTSLAEIKNVCAIETE